MSIVKATTSSASPLSGCDYVVPTRRVPTLFEDVSDGLFSEPKTLPPKYFYDDRGSLLFDQICGEPEYYPTRTEDALLARYASDVITSAKPARILELGSGVSRKTRHLLDACGAQSCCSVYSPLDVCDQVLLESGADLVERYKWLDVRPLVGDYTAGLGNLLLDKQRTLVLFLGGSIGNFTDQQAIDFLTDLHATLNGDDRLLLGADRVKTPEVLHAAYNDRAGVTAEFNLNLLNVLNRELDADFEPDRFRHYACYNPQASQVEMYLIAMQDHRVRFDRLGRTLAFARGDAILTEISRKYTRNALEDLLYCAGFETEKHYESDRNLFSLVLARP